VVEEAETEVVSISAYAVMVHGTSSKKTDCIVDGGYACWCWGKQGHIHAFCKKVPEGQGLMMDVSLLRDLGTWELGQLY
jgi:hypothetical protein